MACLFWIITSLIFSAFSTKTYSLQNDLISKCLKLPQRDWTQMKDLSMQFLNLTNFLVADTQLYKSLCPSVRRSVCRSVRPSVGPSVNTSRKVWKRAFPPLPTRPQLVLAVYPALLVKATWGISGLDNYQSQTATSPPLHWHVNCACTCTIARPCICTLIHKCICTFHFFFGC